MSLPHPAIPAKTLPRNFLQCPREDLIVLIARMLISLISINDKYLPIGNLSSANLTRFHSRTPPAISVYDYLARLAHYNSLENSILIIAIYYIDILSNNYRSFNLNSLTVHRFLLTATTVASKGLCDYFCTNNHYAKVGGINVNELNFLETEFLEKVSWRIIPRNEEIDEKYHSEKVLVGGNKKKHRRVDTSDPTDTSNNNYNNNASSAASITSSSSSSSYSSSLSPSSYACTTADVNLNHNSISTASNKNGIPNKGNNIHQSNLNSQPAEQSINSLTSSSATSVSPTATSVYNAQASHAQSQSTNNPQPTRAAKNNDKYSSSLASSPSSSSPSASTSPTSVGYPTNTSSSTHNSTLNAAQRLTYTHRPSATRTPHSNPQNSQNQIPNLDQSQDQDQDQDQGQTPSHHQKQTLQMLPPGIKLTSKRLLFKKTRIGMGYAEEILDNYYRKMIDLVGGEQINLNSSNRNNNQAVVFVLDGEWSEALGAVRVGAIAP